MRRDAYQPAPKRVLLATDDADLRAELVAALEKDQHHVVELDDGLELLDYLESAGELQGSTLPSAHVVIAALNMPGMSGVALLERLREHRNPLPFIGLAEAGDAPSFARLRALNAAFIFEAPVRLDDVRGALFSLPGGVFSEPTLSHDARLQACLRGTEFLRRV